MIVDRTNIGLAREGDGRVTVFYTLVGERNSWGLRFIGITAEFP
jgi:hypothetical protein